MPSPTTYGWAEQIANDVINQMSSWTFAIDYNVAFKRLYVSELDDQALALTSSSQMQVTITTIETERKHCGWGAQNLDITLGFVCQISVSKTLTDTEIAPLEQFVDNLCDFLSGPRLFASGLWTVTGVKAVYGDHLMNMIREKGQFHLPILVTFTSYMSVN